MLKAPDPSAHPTSGARHCASDPGSSQPPAQVCGGPGHLQVSIYAADEPVGKRRGLNADGSLRKATTAPRLQTVRKARFDSIREFAQYALNAPPSEAIAFGLCELAEARVAVADSDKRQGVVARTRQFFAFPDGAGVLLLDCDPLPGEKPLSAGDLINLLRAAVPELSSVALASKPSSSAHLHTATGAELVGSAGVHIFVPVQEAKRIPEWGAIIADRLWLAGHGRTKVTANGNRLHTTLIDTSVWSPERLCFIRAACQDGVEQRFGEIGYFPGDCDDLAGEGWLHELTPLTEEEAEIAAAIRQIAYSNAEPEARAARERWAEEQLDKRAKLANARGEALDRAAIKLSLLAGECVLPAELVLYPASGDPITVREMLQQGARWDGVRFADPFEPEYGGDPRIALAVFSSGEPHIFSHAHGGQRYLFRSESERQADLSADFSDLGPLPEPERKRRKFEATPAGEFIKGPAPSWLIKGVMPSAALGVVFGEPGSGKTFLAIDLVAAIALGKPWRDHKVKPRKVLYVAAEGVGGFRNRVAAYMRQFDADFQDSLLVISQPPSLLDKADATALIEEAQHAAAGVVVIDTLSQVLAGGDENSSTDMGAALKVCRELHATTGAMVLLVHHSGKDASRGARGWSGLKAAADVEIEVSRVGDSRVARVSKLKDGEDGACFGFRLVPILLAVDDEGDDITSCYVEHCEFVSAAPVRRMGPNQRAVLNALLALTPISGDAVPTADVLARAIEALPVEPDKRDRRRDIVRRALNDLVDHGAVAEAGGKLSAADIDEGATDAA